jgi:DNA adenine methylase
MESLNLVQPVKPAAPYLCDKRKLARRICALIEATPHVGYYEPFVGMGGIFIGRAPR